MGLTVSHLRLIAELRSSLWQIQQEAPADWDSFRDLLIELLDTLLRGANAHKSEAILEEILRQTVNLARVSLTAGAICSRISKTEVYRTSQPVLESPAPSRGTADGINQIPISTGGTYAPSPEPVTRIDRDVVTLSGYLVNDLRATKPPQTVPRYFNTFLTAPGDPTIIADDQPVIRDRSYVLCIEINPERKGPGSRSDVFVDGALTEARKNDEALPLLVVAASRDFEIRPQVRRIELPPEGASSMARFSLRPRFAGRRGLLQAEIFYRGHLLQSKRFEALVVAHDGEEVAASLRPAQTARITFTTTDSFSSDTVSFVPERVFTIDVERDERDQSVDLRFLDRTNGEEELSYYDTTLQAQALGEVILAVRERLLAAVKGETRDEQKVAGFEYIISGSEASLNDWLPALADVGRNLYRALLPETQPPANKELDERTKSALQPGAVIQINPIAGKVTIPWALLYQRPVLLLPGTTRVCDKYVESDNCPDCDSLTDPTVVCPFAFWGYRYAIEQLPCWVTGELPQPLVLLRQVCNGRPLILNFNVWEKFRFWQDHVKKLAAGAHITTLVATGLKDLIRTWQQHGNELDVLYFYTHGGIDKHQPFLEVSDGRIASNFLEACQPSWPHNPLVFLNGCSTGDYGPESFVSLIDDFRKAGACGVIGTECAVPELFAESFASALFPRLFRGERLGEAMLEIRKEFLLKHKNPLALVYSLYAANEISLANRVSAN